jgi:hypothetical protein
MLTTPSFFFADLHFENEIVRANINYIIHANEFVLTSGGSKEVLILNNMEHYYTRKAKEKEIFILLYYFNTS